MRSCCLKSLAVLLLAFSAQAAHARNTQDKPTHPTNGVVIRDGSGRAMISIYHDVKGNRIDAKAFNQALAQGSRFRITPTPSGRYVVLTLLAKDSHRRGLSLAGAPPSIKPGQPLPAFHLRTVGGDRIRNTDLDGQPTLVDFFFSACVACIEELPAMNAYRRQHPGMHFLAVTFDSSREAKRFVHKRHFEWPVAYRGKSLIKQVGVTTYPTMMLLDANGHLLATRTGVIPSNATTTASKPRPGESDAEATRRARLTWLDQWVKKNTQ